MPPMIRSLVVLCSVSIFASNGGPVTASPRKQETTFEHVLLPVVGKPAHPLGLACNYGIDSRGVREACDAGLNYIFWTGMRTKKALAGVREALATDRERMILCAGTGGPFGFHYRSAVESLLRKMKTDYIDIFQMFWLGVTAWDTRGVIDELVALRNEGKIRAIGVTIHNRTRAGRLAANSELDMLQIRYNAAHPGAEQDIFPHLARERRFLCCYTATSWRKLLKPHKGWDGKIPNAADCYRFSLTHPSIPVCLSGPASSEQLRENLEGVAKGPMNHEEISWMRSFGKVVHG